MRHPTDRASRLLAIKRDIADGKFETPERIDGTVDNLLDELRYEPVLPKPSLTVQVRYVDGGALPVRPFPMDDAPVASVYARVLAQLKSLGLFPENHDHQPLVHRGQAYELTPSAPSVERSAGGVSEENENG